MLYTQNTENHILCAKSCSALKFFTYVLYVLFLHLIRGQTNKTFLNLILFIPCILTIITHIYIYANKHLVTKFLIQKNWSPFAIYWCVVCTTLYYMRHIMAHRLDPFGPETSILDAGMHITYIHTIQTVANQWILFQNISAPHSV